MLLLQLVAFTGLAAAAAVVQTTCNANNCLRQVRATNFPSRMGTADCAAYQTTYASPLATTTIYTITNASPDVVPTTTNGPKTIPAYASGCAGDAAYRSACSCIGQTSASIATLTFTRQGAPPTCSTYVLMATSGDANGRYLGESNNNVYLRNGIENGVRVVFSGTRIADAQQPVEVLNSQTNGVPGQIFLDAGDTIGGYADLVCSLASGSNAVTCTNDGGANMFLAGGDNVFFGPPQGSGSDLVAFDVKAVPACS